MGHPPSEGSSGQKLAHVVGTALAGDELLIVAQRDEPALAAQGAHLANVFDVDQRVAVDALEVALLQPLLDDFQRLCGPVLFPGGDDPHPLPFGLKREDLGRIKEKVLLAELADDFP